MKYNIIGTGSKGNAVILNDEIMIDCGVAIKSLREYIPALKLVLLTHEHGDHARPATIRAIARERPGVRWVCGEWLVSKLIDCGVSPRQIDVMLPGKRYNYGIIGLDPFKLTHNVPNIGYKLTVGGERIFYATDTSNLDGITAKDYDMYFIEANYMEGEIHERIANKEIEGIYAYEREAMHNHLSREKADEWLAGNVGSNSKYIYMHSHNNIEWV